MPQPQKSVTDPKGNRKSASLRTTNPKEQVNKGKRNHGCDDANASRQPNRLRMVREMSPGRKKFIEMRQQRLQNQQLTRKQKKAKPWPFPMKKIGKPKPQVSRRKIVAPMRHISSDDDEAFSDRQPSLSPPESPNSRSKSISDTAKVIHETKWLQKVKQNEIAQLELAIKEGRSYSEERETIQKASRHNDPTKSDEIIAMENELMAERQRINQLRVEAEADLQRAAELAEKEAEENAAKLARQRDMSKYSERRSRSPARRPRGLQKRNGNGNIVARNIVRNAQRRILGKRGGGRCGQQFTRVPVQRSAVQRQPYFVEIRSPAPAPKDEDTRFHRNDVDKFKDEQREAFVYRQAKMYTERSNDDLRRMNPTEATVMSRYTDVDKNMGSRYTDTRRPGRVYDEPIDLQKCDSYPLDMRRNRLSPTSHNGGRVRREKTPPHFTSKNFHNLEPQARSPPLLLTFTQQQQELQRRSDYNIDAIVDCTPGSLGDIKAIYRRSGNKSERNVPMGRQSLSPPSHRGMVTPKSSDHEYRYELNADDRTPKFLNENQLEMKLLPLTPALYTGGGMFDKHIQRIQNEFDDRFGLRKRSMDRDMSPRGQHPPAYAEETCQYHTAADRHDGDLREESNRRANPFARCAKTGFEESLANVDERNRAREESNFEVTNSNRYASRRNQYSEIDQRPGNRFQTSGSYWPLERSDDRQAFNRHFDSNVQRSRNQDSPKRSGYQTQSRDYDQLARRPKSRERTTGFVQTEFSSQRERDYPDRTLRRPRSAERVDETAMHMLKPVDRNVLQREWCDKDFCANERDKQNRPNRPKERYSASDTNRGDDYRSEKLVYQQLGESSASNDRTSHLLVAQKYSESGKKLDPFPSSTTRDSRDRPAYGGELIYAHGVRESASSFTGEQYSLAVNKKKNDEFSAYKPSVAAVRQHERSARNIVADDRQYAPKMNSHDFSTTTTNRSTRVDANAIRQSEPRSTGNQKFPKSDGHQNDRSAYRHADASDRGQIMSSSDRRAAETPQAARANMTPIEQKAAQLRWETNRSRSNVSHSRSDDVKQPPYKRTHSPPPPPKFDNTPIIRRVGPFADENFGRPAPVDETADSLITSKRSRIEKSIADKSVERKRIEAPRNDDRYEGAAHHKQQVVVRNNRTEHQSFGGECGTSDRGRSEKYEQVNRRYQNKQTNRRTTPDNRQHTFRDNNIQQADRKYLEQHRLKDGPPSNREKANIESSLRTKAAAPDHRGQRDRTIALRHGDTDRTGNYGKNSSYFDGKR